MKLKRLLILIPLLSYLTASTARADIAAFDINNSFVYIPKIIIINTQTGDYKTLGNVSGKITVDESTLKYIDCDKQHANASYAGPTNPCLLR